MTVGGQLGPRAAQKLQVEAQANPAARALGIHLCRSSQADVSNHSEESRYTQRRAVGGLVVYRCHPSCAVALVASSSFAYCSRSRKLIADDEGLRRQLWAVQYPHDGVLVDQIQSLCSAKAVE